MCVFSTFLKAVLQHLMSKGSAFHRRGPTTRKDRSPKLASFVRVISRKCCSDERVRSGLCIFTIQISVHMEKYFILMRHLTGTSVGLLGLALYDHDACKRDYSGCHVLNSLEFINLVTWFLEAATHRLWLVYYCPQERRNIQLCVIGVEVVIQAECLDNVAYWCNICCKQQWP